MMIRRALQWPIFQDREVWTFLLLIVLANVVFVHAIDQGWLRMAYYNYGRFLLLGLVLAAVVFLFRGWKAPFALLAPLTVWRFNPAWLLLAVLWPPTIGLVTLIGKGLILGTGLDEIRPTLSVALDPGVYPTVLVGAFIGEIVWVGYAVSRLSQRTTIFISSAIVGFFWSSWWLPIVLIGVGVVPGIPVFGLFISMIGIALMCGFIYSHTRSGIVVLALQISVNNSLLIFPVAPNSGGTITFVVFSSVYLLSSLLLYVFFGPRPLLKAPSSSKVVAPAWQS